MCALDGKAPAADQLTSKCQSAAYLCTARITIWRLPCAPGGAGFCTGLRQMPEAERLSTLQLLDTNKAEVEARLAALPIIIETPSMVSR